MIANLPIARRVSEIEDALAAALDRNDFEVVTLDGSRYLRPILPELVAIGIPVPRVSLDQIARDVERALS